MRNAKLGSAGLGGPLYDRMSMSIQDRIETVALPSPPPGWFSAGCCLLADSTLSLTMMQVDAASAMRAWNLAGRRSPEPNIWGGLIRLSVFDGSQERHVIEVPCVRHPMVTRFSDGRWLVVSDSGRKGEGHGFIYAANGSPEREVAIGCDVGQLCPSPDGSLWVGYHDQAGGHPQEGMIVQLDTNADLVWSDYADATRETMLEHACDCYSLTLDGTVAWSCYYPWGEGFPIIRSDGKQVRRWDNYVSGAVALAIDQDHLLLAGGYNQHVNRLALVRLGASEAILIGEMESPLDLYRADLVQGQGPWLHVVSQGEWSKLNLSAVRDAIG